ncbi:hypothetical protein ACKKBG_A12550 [Auxenochlorella protothecoides x Auxenochlorella symbiontica]
MEALEDSIEHSVEGPVEVRPQKLSRLRKAKVRAPIPNDENVAHNSDRIQGCCEATRPEEQTFLHKEPKSPTVPEEVGVAMEAPDRAPSVEAQSDAEEATRGEPTDEGYWDEEDELEDYLNQNFQSSDDEEGLQMNQIIEGPLFGGNDGLDIGDEDTAAETQRILRESAARDRLGRDAGVEKGKKDRSVPLQSVLERMRARKAAALARAPQPPAPLIPSFDDVLGALPAQPARSKVLPAASQTVAADERALAPEPATPAESAASSDLELVDEEGEEACNIVALPSTLKQRRPSTQDLDDFEDDVDSEEELEDGDVLVGEGAGAREGSADSDARSAASMSESEESDSDDDGGSEGAPNGGDGDSESALSDGARSAPGSSPPTAEDPAASTAGDDPGSAGAQQESPNLADVLAAGARAEQASSQAKAARRAEKLQRVFLDMEAELSDEEGAGIRVSDDEDDGLDDRGDLADLIGKERERKRDAAARERLHQEWTAAQDARELQDVLRGLRRGFRRARGDGLWDDEDDGTGRRRVRLDEEGAPSGGSGGLGADLAWLEAFGQGPVEEEEEEEGGFPGLLPGSKGPAPALGHPAPASPEALQASDESSRMLLEALARSAPSASGAPPAGAAAPRASSFLGRRPAVQRLHSSGSMGASSRSYVFGREQDDGAGAAASGDAQGGAVPREEPAPTSFVALSRMVGRAPAGPPTTSAAGLVSRLGGGGRAGTAPAATTVVDAAVAVCLQFGSRAGA